MSKHLWEVKHPYYANEGNYYSNECHAPYKSWAEFIEAEGDADIDYNLVYRWDWREGEDWGAGAYTGDDNYRNGLLFVFFIGQRKALARSAEVQVCRADEPAVIEYLKPRLARLMEIWEPLAPGQQGERDE